MNKMLSYRRDRAAGCVIVLDKSGRLELGVLITNMKSYMGFRLVPKSVTLNDLERRNSHYFALFRRIR